MAKRAADIFDQAPDPEKIRIAWEAAESKREEFRKAHAEIERMTNERRTEEAKKLAAEVVVKNEQARVARAAEAAKIQAEKERIASEKKARQAPDKEKVRIWGLALDQVIKAAPECKDGEANQVISRVKIGLNASMSTLSIFVEAK